MSNRHEHLLMQEETQELHSDVIAFCTLLARIMHRCLMEQDPRIMELLDLPIVQKSEVTNEQAA